MKIVNKLKFYFGILIILFLLFSYFISVNVESGANYIVTDTLLGIIIFHSLFVFIVYLIIAIFFIFTGVRRFKFT
ncbi:MAG: hypothetical protein AABW71_04480 [Nanoarchaeota archaeon]